MIESSDRITFEVYRAAYDLSDRVVYYSELEDKDDEIDGALAGRPSYDGFIRADHIDEAKDVLGSTHTILCGFLISAQDLVHGRECVLSEHVNHSQL